MQAAGGGLMVMESANLYIVDATFKECEAGWVRRSRRWQHAPTPPELTPIAVMLACRGQALSAFSMPAAILS